MKYKIIKATECSYQNSNKSFYGDFFENFEKQVEIHMKKGWVPIGGISVTYEKGSNLKETTFICQAMIKEENEKSV
jgi:hypothetical protein